MPRPHGDKPHDLLALMPISETIGIEIDRAEPDTVVGTLSWSPERCTSGGTLHGGALMALADSVGAICAYLNLPDGATTSTIESKTNFFRGVHSGFARALAAPRHVGRRTIVIQTDVVDHRNQSVALVIQTQAVLQGA